MEVSYIYLRKLKMVTTFKRYFLKRIRTEKVTPFCNLQVTNVPLYIG